MTNLIHQINQLTEQGHNEQAQKLALQGISQNPSDGAYWIGLGNALYGLGQIAQAKEAYEKAIPLMPDDPISPSNLAGVCFEEKDFEHGLRYCNIALERNPEYVNALIHQGNLLAELDRQEEALTSYKKALGIDPQNALVLFNMANPLLNLNRVEEAIECYVALLDQEPLNTDYLFALATAYERLENFAKSAWTYLNILKVQPSSLTHISLGGCLYHLKMNASDPEVLEILDQWLILTPENPIAQHTAETLCRNDKITRASADYVQELFDAFADSFDAVLKELDYQSPQVIATSAAKYAPENCHILDLGCGTGLCGVSLSQKIKYKSLIGVDLSAKMLEKARDRGVYSQLVQEDILKFLTQHKQKFDLIVSADVFTYLGDLSDLFSLLHNSLTSQGYALFTVTESTKKSARYTLEPSGRFMHSKSYIEQELEKNSLNEIDIQSVSLRKEMGESVLGLQIICSKKI